MDSRSRRVQRWKMPVNTVSLPETSHKEETTPPPSDIQSEKKYSISTEWRKVMKELVKELIIEVLGESSILEKHPEIIPSIMDNVLKNEDLDEEELTVSDEQWSSFFTSHTYKNNEATTVKNSKQLTIQCILTEDARDKSKDPLILYPFGVGHPGVDIPDNPSFTVSSFGSRDPGKKLSGTTITTDGTRTITFPLVSLKKLKMTEYPLLFTATMMRE